MLEGNNSRGMLLMAKDFLSCKLLLRVLGLPGKENDPQPETKPLLGA